VRKTLNIDAAKLKRAKAYLGMDTETEVIDLLLDRVEYERELDELLRKSSPSWESFPETNTLILIR
jgi:ribosomal protein L12E/L44/L45/RPP1/RPP2